MKLITGWHWHDAADVVLSGAERPSMKSFLAYCRSNNTIPNLTTLVTYVSGSGLVSAFVSTLRVPRIGNAGLYPISTTNSCRLHDRQGDFNAAHPHRSLPE
jgi:hypothetical protein